MALNNVNPILHTYLLHYLLRQGSCDFRLAMNLSSSLPNRPLISILNSISTKNHGKVWEKRKKFSCFPSQNTTFYHIWFRVFLASYIKVFSESALLDSLRGRGAKIAGMISTAEHTSVLAQKRDVARGDDLSHETEIVRSDQPRPVWSRVQTKPM